jgi:hypothetical protein
MIPKKRNGIDHASMRSSRASTDFGLRAGSSLVGLGRR